MGWWTSIVNRSQTASDEIIEQGQWAWSWIKTPVIKTVTYAANTLTEGLSFLIAVRHAIPGLTTPESLKVVRATTLIMTRKIIPLILLNFLNIQTQAYLRQGYEDDVLTPDRPNISSAIAIDWASWLLLHWMALELVVETLVLDARAPALFNAHKAELPPSPHSPCKDCNYKRRVKGTISDVFVLSANDLLSWLVGQTPYIGQITSQASDVFIAGDVIARSAMLDLCSRHRTTKSETLLVLGASYTLANILMNELLKATVGIPPYLIHRTLQHLVLIWHMKIAAHMNIEYVAPEKNTFPDPIIHFEQAMRVGTDILIAGSIDKTIKLLKPVPGRVPYISVIGILKKMTVALNSDIETLKKIEMERTGNLKFFKNFRVVLPPIFRSTYNTIHNPVVRLFWEDFQEALYDILAIIKTTSTPLKKLNRTNFPGVASTVKLALPEILFQRFNIPKKLTVFLLTLSKDDEFWGFIEALQQWTHRHGYHKAVLLATAKPEQLDMLHHARVTTSQGDQPHQEEKIPISTPNTDPELFPKRPVGDLPATLDSSRGIGLFSGRRTVTRRQPLSAEDVIVLDARRL